MITIYMLIAVNPVFARGSDITVYLDKVPVWFPDQQPYVDQNGRTVVPVRFISEALGAKVEWDNILQTVTVTKNQTTVVLTLNKKAITINGVERLMDTAAVATNQGRTMVPLRFVSEALGQPVGWDGASHSVYIGDGAQQYIALANAAQTMYYYSPTGQVQTTLDSSFKLQKTLPAGINKLMIITTKSGKSDNSIFVLRNGLLEEKPYLYYGPGEYKVTIAVPRANSNSYSGFDYFNVINLDPRPEEEVKYLFPEGDIQSENPEIVTLAMNITKGKSTDMAKTRAIHDYVAKNVAYDTKTYYAGRISDYNWDAVEVLHRKLAICEGYANLNAALHRAVGIKAKVVHGQAIWADMGETWENTEARGHAWNEIFVDGRWVIEDTCWDAGYVNGRSFTFKYRTKYFDPTPREFARDHRTT